MKDQFRFGIGEWYGQSYVQLTTEQRVAYAQLQALELAKRSDHTFEPNKEPGCDK